MRGRTQKKTLKNIIKTLKNTLNETDQDEVVTILRDTSDQRISLVLRQNEQQEFTFLIELVLHPQINNKDTYGGNFKNYLTLLDELVSLGYEITVVEAGNVSCEREVESSSIEKEVNVLNKYIKHFLQQE